MSLKKGIKYQLTPFGRWCDKEKNTERFRERLSAEELKDYVLLVKRPTKSLSDGEFQRVLDHMVKAGIIEEVPL